MTRIEVYPDYLAARGVVDEEMEEWAKRIASARGMEHRSAALEMMTEAKVVMTTEEAEKRMVRDLADDRYVRPGQIWESSYRSRRKILVKTVGETYVWGRVVEKDGEPVEEDTKLQRKWFNPNLGQGWRLAQDVK